MYLHFPDCAIGRWMCLDGLTKNIKHNWVFDWCFPLEHQLSWYIEFAQIHVFTGATDVSKKNLYQHFNLFNKKIVNSPWIWSHKKLTSLGIPKVYLQPRTPKDSIFRVTSLRQKSPLGTGRLPFFPREGDRSTSGVRATKPQRFFFAIGMFPKIGGFPSKSSNFNRVFHYKPSIFGVPLFLETPIEGGQENHSCWQKKQTVLFGHHLWLWNFASFTQREKDAATKIRLNQTTHLTLATMEWWVLRPSGWSMAVSISLIAYRSGGTHVNPGCLIGILE